jgi:hypothetical protein
MHRLVRERSLHLIEIPEADGTETVPSGHYLVPTPEFAANLAAAGENLRWVTVPAERRARAQ